MENYILISDYMGEEKYRSSFNKLAMDTFGLDFEEWYQKNLYQNRYIYYSYVYEDKVVANVSINKMNLILEGQNKKALQIGTVVTHPEHRNRGLAASLINHVIEKYENEYDIIYLFANDSVLDFYTRFGFKKVIESSYELDVRQLKSKESSIRKLNRESEEDYKTIVRLGTKRYPISQKLGVYNDIWPLLVYCLYEYEDDLNYLIDEDTIVIARREDGVLHIYDILSLKPIDLDSIIERAAKPSDRKIEFHFIPEGSKYNISSVPRERTNDVLFIRTKNNLPKEILFPMTSHT